MKNVELQFGSLSIEFLVALAVMSTALVTSSRIVFGLQDAVVIRGLTAQAHDILRGDAAMTRVYTGPLQNTPSVVAVATPFTVEKVLHHTGVMECSACSNYRACYYRNKLAISR